MSESVIEQNPSGRSPAEQGSDVPLAWKPTPNEPLPTVRCTQIKKDGTRCKRWSYRGALKCVTHLSNGGKLKNVYEHADALVEAARLRLLENSDLAIETLEQLLEPGSSEGIRLKASTEILDRVGIRGGFEIKHDVEVTANPADEVRKRLEKLAEGARTVQEMRDKIEHPDGEDIVEGVVLEDTDDDEQETLF